MTMCGKSPCAGCSENCRSPCSCRVGMPVEGPPRWYMTRTGPGHSVIDAKPMPSTMSAKPGPLVAVAAHAHVRRADRHVDRADLVLALHDEQLVVALLSLEEDALVRRRRDGVVGLERASRLQLGDRVDLIALGEDARLRLAIRLERVRKVFRALVLLHVLERELG